MTTWSFARGAIIGSRVRRRRAFRPATRARRTAAGLFAVIVLCVAAGALGYDLAGGFHPKRPTLVSYFDPNSPNWRGASFGGGVLCWKLLDTAKEPRWSADYCSVGSP